VRELKEGREGRREGGRERVSDNVPEALSQLPMMVCASNRGI